MFFLTITAVVIVIVIIIIMIIIIIILLDIVMIFTSASLGKEPDLSCLYSASVNKTVRRLSPAFLSGHAVLFLWKSSRFQRTTCACGLLSVILSAHFCNICLMRFLVFFGFEIQ